MAIIYTYPVKSTLVDADSVVITDSEDRNMTKQLGIGVIMAPIYALQDEVAEIKQDIKIINENIASIESQISVIQENIAALQNCCAENSQLISELSEDVASNSSEISTNASNISSNSNSIISNNKAISALSNEIANLQAQLDECCSGPPAELRILSVTPQYDLKDGGTRTIQIIGENTTWRVGGNQPTSITSPDMYDTGFEVLSFTPISDTEISAEVSFSKLLEPKEAEYASLVVTSPNSIASCTECWYLDPNPEEPVVENLIYNICELGPNAGRQCKQGELVDTLILAPDTEGVSQYIKLRGKLNDGEVEAIYSRSEATTTEPPTYATQLDLGLLSVLSLPAGDCTAQILNGQMITECWKFEKCEGSDPEGNMPEIYYLSKGLGDLTAGVRKVTDGTNTCCYVLSGDGAECATMDPTYTMLQEIVEGGCNSAECVEGCIQPVWSPLDSISPNYDKASEGQSYLR